MVDCQPRVYFIARLHLALTEQCRLAIRENTQPIITIAADNKEIIGLAVRAADQADAILIRPGLIYPHPLPTERR